MKGGKTLMRSHLRSVAKRKVSDFLLREEGMVGNRSAFATAALVSTTALAMTLLAAPDADAHPGPREHCPNHGNQCNPNQKCCPTYDGGTWNYNCIPRAANCGC